MKQAIKAIGCFLLALILAFFVGCDTGASTRQEAAKDFKDETQVATFDGHDYLIWVHTSIAADGHWTYVSGLTHSASCKNPGT